MDAMYVITFVEYVYMLLIIGNTSTIKHTNQLMPPTMHRTSVDHDATASTGHEPASIRHHTLIAEEARRVALPPVTLVHIAEFS